MNRVLNLTNALDIVIKLLFKREKKKRKRERGRERERERDKKNDIKRRQNKIGEIMSFVIK